MIAPAKAPHILIILLFSLLAGCSPALPPIEKPQAPVEKPQAHAPVVTKEAPIEQASTTTIALLLPLSGPSQHVGHAMFDAAQLALFGANMPGLTLLPIDTEGKEDKLALSTKQAIEQGAKIIIGPLFSKKTATIARIAKPYNINVLSFSNDKTLAGNGVFLMGFMLDEQIERVTSYAMQQGITDFYALVPANAYGKLAVEKLRNVAVQGNGSVNRAEFYAASGNDLDLTVKNIADALNSDASPMVKGLLIPEGGERLAAITTLLEKYKVDKTKLHLIGSGQWDDVSSTQNAYLTGGWFASFNPAQHAVFEDNFKQQYGYTPIRIASLAYDAVALSYNILNQPEGGTFSKEALTNPRGFAGTDGIFRLQTNGIAERRLAVLQVEDGHFQILEPAAQGFENNAQ